MSPKPADILWFKKFLFNQIFETLTYFLNTAGETDDGVITREAWLNYPELILLRVSGLNPVSACLLLFLLYIFLIILFMMFYTTGMVSKLMCYGIICAYKDKLDI